jgi:hypothetical protein
LACHPRRPPSQTSTEKRYAASASSQQLSGLRLTLSSSTAIKKTRRRRAPEPPDGACTPLMNPSSPSCEAHHRERDPAHHHHSTPSAHHHHHTHPTAIKYTWEGGATAGAPDGSLPVPHTEPACLPARQLLKDHACKRVIKEAARPATSALQRTPWRAHPENLRRRARCLSLTPSPPAC